MLKKVFCIKNTYILAAGCNQSKPNHNKLKHKNFNLPF